MGFFSRFLGSDASDKERSLDMTGASPPASVPPAAEAGSPNWDVGALTKETPQAAAPQAVEYDSAATADLQPKVVDVIKTVFDPEIPVDIYELGLIYDIKATADRQVHVTMTLTSPACPSAQQLPSEVRFKVKAIEGVSDASVEVVWEPPWDKDRMSDAAKLQLGFF